MSLPLERVVSLLSRQLGLSPQSLGGRAIESALQRRMGCLKLESLAEYGQKVEQDRRELDELIEAVVVPETWFFRYPESFRHLTEFCRPIMNQRIVRILSAPCATGEECYSAAISLKEAGLPLHRVQIDGVDVSRRVIDLARVGIYGDNAFREPSMPPREKYFIPHQRDWQVRPELQERMRFRTANLAQENFLADEIPYDVIFCRNLFIYLTDEARRLVLQTIDRLLLPDGIVYMGHAEPLTLLDQQYKSLSPPQAFVFSRNVSGVSRTISPSVKMDLSSVSTATSQVPACSSPSGMFPPITAGMPVPRPADPTARQLLDGARGSIDRGNILEAEQACQKYLEQVSPSAEAYALLGSARILAQDFPSAERHLTRALYLDPSLYEALLQMLILAERRGDAVAASNYRRRLSNVDRKGSK